MALRSALALLVPAMLGAQPAAAYLYWTRPSFTGTPAKGDEPGIAQPMPGASPRELQANMLWSMRAGLNVAALQCQFAPALMTVRNYNDLLKGHSAELTTTYKTLTAYYKRTTPKGWQKALDQYTTRTYNGFSTLKAQIGFCDTAGQIGREAIGQPKGKLTDFAAVRLREFRNSLVPAGDGIFAVSVPTYGLAPIDDPCLDAKGRRKRKCG